MILVTGATGNVGGEVVKALVAAGEEVRALVRAPDEPGIPVGATGVVGDLNRPETLSDAVDGVREVFLLPGYDDMPALLATLAAAGVEHVVLLSSGAAASGDRSNAVTRYMISSEEAVQSSGIGWTILRASGFMSNAFRWLPQLRLSDEVRAPFAQVPVAAIDPFDIAAVAAKAFAESAHQGRIHRLTGPEPLLAAGQLEVLGRLLGRDLQLRAQTNDEAKAEMSATMPAEYVAAFFSYFVDGTYDDSVVLPGVPDVLGRPARTFEQWAAEHLAAFR